MKFGHLIDHIEQAMKLSAVDQDIDDSSSRLHHRESTTTIQMDKAGSNDYWEHRSPNHSSSDNKKKG
jgi:hypothetical protein